MERYGVEVIHAEARFIDPHQLELSDGDQRPHTASFRFAVIATGSRPKQLRTSLPCLPNETLPARLVIAGVGPVGIEMAQAFSPLGSEVTVVAPESRVLPNDGAEVAAILQRLLASEGVHFCLGRALKDHIARAAPRPQCSMTERRSCATWSCSRLAASLE